MSSLLASCWLTVLLSVLWEQECQLASCQQVRNLAKDTTALHVFVQRGHPLAFSRKLRLAGRTLGTSVISPAELITALTGGCRSLLAASCTGAASCYFMQVHS